MCLSNNFYPEKPRVTFDDTILYGARVVNPTTQQSEHVLAYYNKVNVTAPTTEDFGWDRKPSSSDDFGWDVIPTAGNAMLFAVPIAPNAPFGKENLIAVSEWPHFMEDYKTAITPVRRSRGVLRGDMSFSLSAKAVEVVQGFDDGLYDVVLAPNATSILGALDRVNESKRPQLNEKLYQELDIVYPGFAFALFCFAESDAERAGCAAIRYIPKFDHLIFLPGLDGHNGSIERGLVKINHTLVVGTHDINPRAASRVDFQDLIYRGPATVVREPKDPPYWMLRNVIGRIYNDVEVPQGDFLFKVSDVKNGIFRCRRQVPPGWKNLPDHPADPASTPFYLKA